MVNDMKDVDDVNVTCKPKKIYPSSATNSTSNDMVTEELTFKEEHELHKSEENDFRIYYSLHPLSTRFSDAVTAYDCTCRLHRNK